MKFPTTQELQVAINDTHYYLAKAKQEEWKDDIATHETLLFALKYLKNKIERRERKNKRQSDMTTLKGKE